MTVLPIDSSSIPELKRSLAEFALDNKTTTQPFDTPLIEFCERLSKELFKVPKLSGYPDLAALAYWLRKTHLYEIRDRFMSLNSQNERLVPRGIVFHIPPSNVDTLFIYSWIVSLLVGNPNIIRIPSRENPTISCLLDIVAKLIQEPPFERIKKATLLISYGHEKEITRLLSHEANVRVVWGGDETIKTIRKIPLPLRAKELVFPDRFSAATIHAKKYSKTASEEQQQVASHFFNDLFWFDQRACSSPRAIFWIGNREDILAASEVFYHNLTQSIESRKHKIPLGGILEKKAFTYNQSIELQAAEIQEIHNTLTVMKIPHPLPGWRRHCGFGLIYHLEFSDLNHIIPFLSGKDQTLATYGFDHETLTGFAYAVKSLCIDRIVPIGQALSFHTTWDGMDLLQELTRRIRIDV
ncbi:MAG: acyl-CoA reductase [Waddliaceae bacterium]